MEEVRLVVDVERDSRKRAEEERVELQEKFKIVYFDEKEKIRSRHARHEFNLAHLFRLGRCEFPDSLLQEYFFEVDSHLVRERRKNLVEFRYFLVRRYLYPLVDLLWLYVQL